MTKRADYALLALSHLARAAADDPNRLANTKEIAEQFEIPIELLAKILQILSKSGLVASYPGPTGGYRLLRPPSAISVAEVVLLVDGPVSILHCSNGQEMSCKQFSRCTIRDPLVEIEDRVKNLLASISIEEISGAPAPSPRTKDFSRKTFAASIPVAQVG
jgi:Rrf2 family protein